MNQRLSSAGYLGFRIAERESGILSPLHARGPVSPPGSTSSNNFLFLPAERAAWADELVHALGSA